MSLHSLTSWDKLVIGVVWASALAIAFFGTYCIWDFSRCLAGGNCL